MDRMRIFEQVAEICRDVFDNEDLDVTEAMSPADMEEWDSLSHISLMNEVEEKFHISFTLEEIAGSNTIGGLVTAVERHLHSKKEL